jgi:hypothetical protein
MARRGKCNCALLVTWISEKGHSDHIGTFDFTGNDYVRAVKFAEYQTEKDEGTAVIEVDCDDGSIPLVSCYSGRGCFPETDMVGEDVAIAGLGRRRRRRPRRRRRR